MTDYQFERLLELQIAGDYRRIVEEFRFTNFDEALIGLDAYLILGEIENAEYLLKIWKDKVSSAVQLAWITLYEGRILLLRHQNEEAERVFKEALLMPYYDRYIEHFLKIRLGETYYYQKRFDEARAIIEEVITELEDSSDNYRLAIALSDIGRIYNKMKKSDKAVDSFKKAKKLFQEMNNERAANACTDFMDRIKKD